MDLILLKTDALTNTPGSFTENMKHRFNAVASSGLFGTNIIRRPEENSLSSAGSHHKPLFNISKCEE